MALTLLVWLSGMLKASHQWTTQILPRVSGLALVFCLLCGECLPCNLMRAGRARDASGANLLRLWLSASSVKWCDLYLTGLLKGEGLGPLITEQLLTAWPFLLISEALLSK